MESNESDLYRVSFEASSERAQQIADFLRDINFIRNVDVVPVNLEDFNIDEWNDRYAEPVKEITTDKDFTVMTREGAEKFSQDHGFDALGGRAYSVLIRHLSDQSAHNADDRVIAEQCVIMHPVTKGAVIGYGANDLRVATLPQVAQYVAKNHARIPALEGNAVEFFASIAESYRAAVAA